MNLKTTQTPSKLLFKVNILLVFLFVATTVFSQNQYRNKKNAVTLGINVVDDSFTSDSNPFNFLTNWNFKKPFYVAYTRNVSRAFNVVANFTYNEYEADKLVDGRNIEEGEIYFSIDGMLQYDLSSWSKDETSGLFYYIKPFLTVGLGYSSIADLGRPTYNYGFGLNFWFESLFEYEDTSSIFKDLGLSFQTQGKSSFEPKELGNQIQHLAGLIYRF